MKHYGGIDLHSNNSVIHLVDEQGDSVLKKRVTNDLTVIVMLLTPFFYRIKGRVVESSYNWYCLVDGLMDAGFKVHLANTAAIQQYSGLKHGDDERFMFLIPTVGALGESPLPASLQATVTQTG